MLHLANVFVLFLILENLFFGDFISIFFVFEEFEVKEPLHRLLFYQILFFKMEIGGHFD
jgi:hypothetical protein